MTYKAIFDPVNKISPVAVLYVSSHRLGSKANEKDAMAAYMEKYGEDCTRIITTGEVIEESRTETRREKLARRIISLDTFGARDARETVETVAEQIKRNPADVISYLLDIIDNMQD